MMLVGLTGGIGSGKSTVAQMFRELGVPVYDSDFEAKKMMAISKKLRKAIKELLGDEAYQGESLNRKFIAEKVFKAPELLKKLNSIVHPAVKEHFLQWVSEQSTPYVVQETALIFENGSQNQYDYVVLVTAPLDVRLKRVMDRDKVAEQAVLDRMKNQLDDNQKIDLSHFCIENLDMETTKEKVKQLHLKLLALASKF